MAKTLRTAALVVGAVAMISTGIGAVAGSSLFAAGLGAAAPVLGTTAGALTSFGAIAAATATGKCTTAPLRRLA